MQLFYQPEIQNGAHSLDVEESRHALKVLRRNIGDLIDITDGQGLFYQARITSTNPKKCEFQIESKREVPSSPSYRHIAIAPTKNIDRTEWFVEKAVEFGIDRISFLTCAHSERKILKMERLRKKAVIAMKQSLKAHLPQLDELTSFRNFLATAEADGKFIAHVDQENRLHLKDQLVAVSNLVLIGPEGDFSDEEVALAMTHGFQKVSLGESRLRTETAGIAACHLFNLNH